MAARAGQSRRTSFEYPRFLASAECRGNLGSQQRFNYSAVGADVNLASQIEGLCKAYGFDILVSEATHELATDFAALELGNAMVKGKLISTQVWVLIGDNSLLVTEIFAKIVPRLSSALSALNAGRLRIALEELNQCRQLHNSPFLAPFYNHIDGSMSRQEVAAG